MSRSLFRYSNVFSYKLFRNRVYSLRLFSSNSIFISPEVKTAVNEHAPVVALESTILTHGLPYPENIKLANKVETLLRNKGVIPATIGLVKGVPTIGLNSSQLEELCSENNTNNTINDDSRKIKISRRDIGHAVANGLSGGTTVSGTMILANLAGIKIFATGGLGGVHMDVDSTMDISADLDEFSKTPVSVICAGPKSVLDIYKTLEYLETKGVYVSTFGPKGTNIPGFWKHDSGVKSPYNFQTPKEAASVIFATNNLKLNMGNIFCIPAPKEIALDPQIIDSAIQDAIILAQEAGIKGKNVTPFLLQHINLLTNGKSVQANVQFMLNNASHAADIAIELSRMQLENFNIPHNDLPYDTVTKTNCEKGTKVKNKIIKKNEIKKPTSSLSITNCKDNVQCLVIGSVSLDTNCTLNGNLKSKNASKKKKVNNENKALKDLLYTSTPGKIETTVGGVAHNITLAFSKAVNSYRFKEFFENFKPKVRLISCVSDDSPGNFILKQLKNNENIDTSGIKCLNKDASKKHTAQYVAINDESVSGELVMACADMDIINDNILPNDVENEFNRIIKTKTNGIKKNPLSWVCVDGNVNENLISSVLKMAHDYKTFVAFEPTSVKKCTKIFVDLKKISENFNQSVKLNIPQVNQSNTNINNDKLTNYISNKEENFEKLYYKIQEKVLLDTRVHLITPNEHELTEMVSGLGYYRNYFLNKIPNWNFENIYRQEVNLEKSPMDNIFSNSFTTEDFVTNNKKIILKNKISDEYKFTEEEIKNGISLSAYIPHVVVKGGKKGVLYLFRCKKTIYKDLYYNFLNKYIFNPNVYFDIIDLDSHYVFAFVLPPPTILNTKEIISPSGAGDTFLGVLLSNLVSNGPKIINKNIPDYTLNKDSDFEIANVLLNGGLLNAQKAAILTLQSPQCVSPLI